MAKKKEETPKVEETKNETTASAENIPHPKGAQISFMVMGTKFDTMEEWIAIMKNNHEQTRQDWIDAFIIFLQDYEPQYQKSVPHMTEEELFAKIDSVPALTVADAFSKYQGNSEQLMRALSYFDPEAVVAGVDAKLINEETLTKTQTRTVFTSEFDKNDVSRRLSEDMFETKTITYDDHYALYKIEGKTLHLDEDAYVVGCNCTTTGKKYYLFVESEFASDAITAIASTMRNKEGNRMNREEYLTIESES